MAQKIQLRRGNSTEWSSVNPILSQGELGLELDTLLYKIGDGTTAWNSLAYQSLSSTFNLLTLNAQSSEPSAANAGTLKIYSKSFGGRILPKIVGPSGLDVALQPGFFGNGIQLYAPGSNTTPNVIGGPALTAVGTVSHPTLAAGNLRLQTSRFNTISAATANSPAELRVAATRIWRGDTPGQGGFFHRTRFSIVSTVATQRSFFGFTSSTAATSTTQEPNALINMIGIGNGLNQTTLRMYTNDAAGTATEVNLGASFPANDPTAVYDLTLFAAPNSTVINWEVTNLTTNVTSSGSFNTDIVPTTTFLAYHAYMNNGGTAAAVNFDLMRIYTETDY